MYILFYTLTLHVDDLLNYFIFYNDLDKSFFFFKSYPYGIIFVYNIASDLLFL